MTLSIISFRVYPLPKPYQKYIHAFFHTCTVVFIIFGLSAEFVSNNLKSLNGGVYHANLFSMHSIIGIFVITLYGLNFFVGIGSFLLYSCLNISEETKKSILPYHVFLGVFISFAGFFTVLSGIVHLTDYLNCNYIPPQSGPDINTAANYNNLYGGCQIGNAIGILVMFVALLVAYTLFDFPSDNNNNNNNNFSSKNPPDHLIRNPLL